MTDLTPGIVALQRAIAISGIVFFSLLLVMVVTRILDGTLPLDGLLRVKSGAWAGQPSPARMAALISTVGFVATFLPSVLQHPDQFHILDVPQGWVLAVGGTHLTYLASKVLAAFIGRH